MTDEVKDPLSQAMQEVNKAGAAIVFELADDIAKERAAMRDEVPIELQGDLVFLDRIEPVVDQIIDCPELTWHPLVKELRLRVLAD